jgi:hypothetical protein
MSSKFLYTKDIFKLKITDVALLRADAIFAARRSADFIDFGISR